MQAFWEDQRALLDSALATFCSSQEAEFIVVAGMRGGGGGDVSQCKAKIADALVQRRFLERSTAAEESVLRQPLFQGTVVGQRVAISEAQLDFDGKLWESGGEEVGCQFMSSSPPDPPTTTPTPTFRLRQDWHFEIDFERTSTASCQQCQVLDVWCRSVSSQH